jgi:signal transduction histidine kinase
MGCSPYIQIEVVAGCLFWICGFCRKFRQTEVPPKPDTDMRKKIISLSQRYATALRKHLKICPRGSLRPALKLGRQAVALGLETLELARIHEQAVAELRLPKNKEGLIKRAEVFFTGAIAPLVEAYRVARKSKNELNRINGILDRRTAELVAANRRLQRGVAQCKSVEAAHKKSGEHCAKVLKESLRLQQGLQHVAHQVLASQEDERKKISRDLQDEIAQSLLGIHVRLLSLKQGARTNAKGLRNEIAGAQRLVINSAKSVRRFARELDHPKEPRNAQFIRAL